MNPESTAQLLQKFPLFEDLNDRDALIVASFVKEEKLEKHTIVYKTNDPSDYLYFLVKGVVKVGTHSSDGREVIKSILHPLSMFGELGLVGEKNRPEFAMSMHEGATLLKISISDLQQLMQSNHGLCMKVLFLVGSRLRRVEERMEGLIFKDARTRIIEFLKDAANRRGRKVGFETLLKHSLTQQDIANITGTSRQTVTSVLNELKKENLIYFNRRSILIRDLNQLA
jgi:CRP/FNR family cyclic AMP-dependent transcriptional regulator